METDPLIRLQAALIEANWDRVRLIERLDPTQARSLMGDALDDAGRRAQQEIVPLKLWDEIPERNVRVYRQPDNMARMHRVLDFVLTRERVLDIGTNYGYFSGVLLRDSNLSHYIGIDLSDHYLDSVRTMLRVNRLEQRSVHLETKDLYSLDDEWMSDHSPSLIVMLEVLEHLPDPAGALRTIAIAMPQGADLLFSVPMLNRLESCWGHLSLFHHSRVQELCREAGLHVQHVEPLHNTWTLVLASPRPQMSSRVPLVGSQPVARSAAPPSTTFQTVPIRRRRATRRSRWSSRSRGVDLRVEKDGVHVKVEADREAPDRGHYGGVEMTVPPIHLLRLELSFSGAEHIKTVFVEGAGPDRRRRVRWTWSREARAILTDRPATWVLRTDRSTPPFELSTDSSDLADVTTLHVFLDVAAGQTAEMTLRRAAVVPLVAEGA